MAIRLHKLAVALGVFIVSAPAFSHGHHSHGKPLTEIEQKAANGVFEDESPKQFPPELLYMMCYVIL